MSTRGNRKKCDYVELLAWSPHKTEREKYSSRLEAILSPWWHHERGFTVRVEQRGSLVRQPSEIAYSIIQDTEDEEGYIVKTYKFYSILQALHVLAKIVNEEDEKTVYDFYNESKEEEYDWNSVPQAPIFRNRVNKQDLVRYLVLSVYPDLQSKIKDAEKTCKPLHIYDGNGGVEFAGGAWVMALQQYTQHLKGKSPRLSPLQLQDEKGTLTVPLPVLDESAYGMEWLPSILRGNASAKTCIRWAVQALGLRVDTAVRAGSNTHIWPKNSAPARQKLAKAATQLILSEVPESAWDVVYAARGRPEDNTEYRFANPNAFDEWLSFQDNAADGKGKPVPMAAVTKTVVNAAVKKRRSAAKQHGAAQPRSPTPIGFTPETDYTVIGTLDGPIAQVKQAEKQVLLHETIYTASRGGQKTFSVFPMVSSEQTQGFQLHEQQAKHCQEMNECLKSYPVCLDTSVTGTGKMIMASYMAAKMGPNDLRGYDSVLVLGLKDTKDTWKRSLENWGYVGCFMFQAHKSLAAVDKEPKIPLTLSPNATTVNGFLKLKYSIKWTKTKSVNVNTKSGESEEATTEALTALMQELGQRPDDSNNWLKLVHAAETRKCHIMVEAQQFFKKIQGATRNFLAEQLITGTETTNILLLVNAAKLTYAENPGGTRSLLQILAKQEYTSLTKQGLEDFTTDIRAGILQALEALIKSVHLKRIFEPSPLWKKTCESKTASCLVIVDEAHMMIGRDSDQYWALKGLQSALPSLSLTSTRSSTNVRMLLTTATPADTVEKVYSLAGLCLNVSQGQRIPARTRYVNDRKLWYDVSEERCFPIEFTAMFRRSSSIHAKMALFLSKALEFNPRLTHDTYKYEFPRDLLAAASLTEAEANRLLQTFQKKKPDDDTSASASALPADAPASLPGASADVPAEEDPDEPDDTEEAGSLDEEHAFTSDGLFESSLTLNKFKDISMSYTSQLYVFVSMLRLFCKPTVEEGTALLDAVNTYAQALQDRSQSKKNILQIFGKQTSAIHNTKSKMVARMARNILDSKPHRKLIIICPTIEGCKILTKELIVHKPLIITGSIKRVPDIIERFQQPSFSYRVLIGTDEKLSTGISLHDTYGLFPRHIILIPNYNSLSLHQTYGRMSRFGSRSNGVMDIVFAEGENDGKFQGELNLRYKSVFESIRNSQDSKGRVVHAVTKAEGLLDYQGCKEITYNDKSPPDDSGLFFAQTTVDGEPVLVGKVGKDKIGVTQIEIKDKYFKDTEQDKEFEAWFADTRTKFLLSK